MVLLFWLQMQEYAGAGWQKMGLALYAATPFRPRRKPTGDWRGSKCGAPVRAAASIPKDRSRPIGRSPASARPRHRSPVPQARSSTEPPGFSSATAAMAPRQPTVTQASVWIWRAIRPPRLQQIAARVTSSVPFAFCEAAPSDMRFIPPELGGSIKAIGRERASSVQPLKRVLRLKNRAKCAVSA